MLQHINSKWSSSEIARGDPTLYPYDKSVFASGHKWIANSNTTTGDVYAALGSPSLFRLRFLHICTFQSNFLSVAASYESYISFRYGWSDNKTDEPPSPSTPSITCSPNVEPQNIISNKTESAGFTGKQMFGLDNTFTMLPSADQVNDRPPSENIPPDGQVKSMV